MRVDVKARRSAELLDQIVDGRQRLTESRRCCFARFLFTGRGDLPAIPLTTARSCRSTTPYAPLGLIAHPTMYQRGRQTIHRLC